MIQEIKFKNFLSFRDETTFSFVAQNNDNFAEKSQIIQKKDGTRLLRLALVFGYNASGKSNLIEVFNFLGDFWRRKTDDPEKDIFLIPFKLDKVSPHKHSFFEIIFYVGETKYWYQLELDNKKVYLEKLSYYKTTQPVMLFERTIKNDKSKIKFGTKLELSPSARDLIELNCLKNVSFFVARNAVNVDVPLIDDAKKWLFKNLFEPIEPSTFLNSYAAEKINRDSLLVKHLLGFLAEADFNIVDVETKTRKKSLPASVLKAIEEDKSISDDMKKQLVENETIETFLSHSVLNGTKKEKYWLKENEESLGTRRTLGLETVIYQVIQEKGFLAVDEIESSLHSKLLEMILFDFLRKESESQIIATTHNDGLLDLVDDLIRKDSVYFIEKKKNGVSDLYKLTDFKGVNRLSSIRTAYRNKRFGATQFSASV